MNKEELRAIARNLKERERHLVFTDDFYQTIEAKCSDEENPNFPVIAAICHCEGADCWTPKTIYS